MPEKELVDATSSRKFEDEKEEENEEEKGQEEQDNKGKRIFVLDIFGRRGHAVEMMSLRDWIREYMPALMVKIIHVLCVIFFFQIMSVPFTSSS